LTGKIYFTAFLNFVFHDQLQYINTSGLWEQFGPTFLKSIRCMLTLFSVM